MASPTAPPSHSWTKTQQNCKCCPMSLLIVLNCHKLYRFSQGVSINQSTDRVLSNTTFLFAIFQIKAQTNDAFIYSGMLMWELNLDFDDNTNLTAMSFPSACSQLGGWSCNWPKCLLLRLSRQCAFPSGMETVKHKQGISSDTGNLIWENLTVSMVILNRMRQTWGTASKSFKDR